MSGRFDAFGPRTPDAAEHEECLVCTDTEYCAQHWPGDLPGATCPVCYLPLASHTIDQSEACDREKAALARFDREQRDGAVLDREAL